MEKTIKITLKTGKDFEDFIGYYETRLTNEELQDKYNEIKEKFAKRKTIAEPQDIITELEERGFISLEPEDFEEYTIQD